MVAISNCGTRRMVGPTPSSAFRSKTEALRRRQARAQPGSIVRHPPEMFTAMDGFPTIPLFVGPGAERDDVIRHVVEQVMHVSRRSPRLARPDGDCVLGVFRGPDGAARPVQDA